MGWGWSNKRRTECQPPPAQPREVRVGIFKRERSSNERDFFVTVRKGIVIVVDGSMGAVTGFRISEAHWW